MLRPSEKPGHAGFGGCLECVQNPIFLDYRFLAFNFIQDFFDARSPMEVVYVGWVILMHMTHDPVKLMEI